MSATNPVDDVYLQLCAGNYRRVESAMDVLAAERGFFRERVKLPLIANCVCIDYDSTLPVEGLVFDNSARLTVVKRADLFGITLDKLHDPQDAPVQSGPIRFCDPRLSLDGIGPSEFDGFGADINQLTQQLFGLNNSELVPLADSNSAYADLFVDACLLPLEERAAAQRLS